MKTITIIIISLIFSLKITGAEIDTAVYTDTAVYNDTVSVLSKIRNSKDYDFVKKYLTDKDDELKIAAIYILAGIDRNTASSDLKNIYDNGSYEVKRNIIYALGEMKLDENINFLKDRLNPSEKKDVSNEAIIALKKIDSEEIIKPLINFMNQFPKNEYLLKYMPALGVKTIKPLFLNLPEGDEDVAVATKHILNEILNENTFDALTEIFKLSISEIDPVKRLAKELIEERKEDAVGPAVQVYKTADGGLRKELINFLSNQTAGRAVVDNLINIWGEFTDDERKIETIDILSNYKIDAYSKFLLDNVAGSSERVKEHILSKMEPKDFFADRINAKIRGTDDENTLKCYIDVSVKLGGGDFNGLLGLLTSPKYTYCAEEILVKLNDKNVDKNLLDYLVLQDKAPVFFKDIIENILVKRAPLSIETLIEGLKDKNKIERCEKVLLQMGKQAIPYLINVLKEDEDELQTAAAAEIFEKMGKMTAPYLIDEIKVEDLWSKMNIAAVLVKFKNNQVIPSLIEVLESDEPGLQYRAIYALRDLGTTSVSELVKSLDTPKENTFVGIVRSLGEIKDRTAVPALKERLVLVQNEKLKFEIEKALKKIGEPR
ncbi:MAG: HEAT repeat domain-containing protein [bacterium]